MCKHFVKASRIVTDVAQWLWKDVLRQLCQPGFAKAMLNDQYVQQNQSVDRKIICLLWCNHPWHQPEHCRRNQAVQDGAVLCFALLHVILHAMLCNSQQQNLCAC